MTKSLKSIFCTGIVMAAACGAASAANAEYKISLRPAEARV